MENFKEKPVYGVAMRQQGVFFAPTLYHFSLCEANKTLSEIQEKVGGFSGKVISERKGCYGAHITIEYSHPKKKTVEYYIVRAWVK